MMYNFIESMHMFHGRGIVRSHSIKLPTTYLCNFKAIFSQSAAAILLTLKYSTTKHMYFKCSIKVKCEVGR